MTLINPFSREVLDFFNPDNERVSQADAQTIVKLLQLVADAKERDELSRQSLHTRADLSPVEREIIALWHTLPSDAKEMLVKAFDDLAKGRGQSVGCNRRH